MPHLVLCSSLGICCLLLSENSGLGALLFCFIFLYKTSIEYWEKEEVGFITCSVLPTVCSNCLRQPKIRVQTSHALVTSNHWAGSKHRRVPTTRFSWGGKPAFAGAAFVLYAAFSVLLVSSVWGHTNWSATARTALACPFNWSVRIWAHQKLTQRRALVAAVFMATQLGTVQGRRANSSWQQPMECWWVTRQTRTSVPLCKSQIGWLVSRDDF